MWTRLLCLTLLVFTSPTATWVASACCTREAECCEEEAPKCPVRSGGEYAVFAAGHAIATISSIDDDLSVVAAPPSLEVRRVPPRPGTPVDVLAQTERPPRYLLTRSLRN